MVLTPFRFDNNFAPHFKIQSAAVGASTASEFHNFNLLALLDTFHKQVVYFPRSAVLFLGGQIMLSDLLSFGRPWSRISPLPGSAHGPLVGPLPERYTRLRRERVVGGRPPELS